MTRRTISRVPLLLLGGTVAFEVASIVLSWGLEPRYDTVLYAVFSVTMAVAGALIATRHPSNRIGWLFLGFALLNAVIADAAQGWGLRAAQQGWPGGPAAELVVTTNWLVSGFGWILTFVLFPGGAFRARRDRVIAAAGAIGAAVALPGNSLSPGVGGQFAAGRNPFAVRWLPTGALFAAGLAIFIGAFVASVVVLVIRFRAARGVERQQLKWFAFAAGCAGIVLPLSVILWTTVPAVRPAAAVVLMGLPLAACIAILRYRLYDIDFVISRTVAYVSLTAVLAVTYIATVVLIGTGAGRRSALATAGATLVVAVAFRPLRDRLQAAVDRRFRPARHRVMHRVAAFLEELRAERAQPEAIGRVLGEALSAAVEVHVLLPESDEWVDVLGRPVDPDVTPARRWPIVRSGAEIGAVTVAGDYDEASTIVPDVLDAVAFVIDVVRLRIALSRQLREVEASRCASPPPPTRSGGGSSAISTTAPSNASSRSASRSVTRSMHWPPKRPPRRHERSTTRSPRSPQPSTSCGSWLAVSVPPSSIAVWRRRSRTWPAASLSPSRSTRSMTAFLRRSRRRPTSPPVKG